MIRAVLCEEYVLLAEGFLMHGMAVESLDCACLALRLDPGCEGAREAVQQAMAASESEGVARSGEVDGLVRRKEQVMKLHRGDPSLNEALRDFTLDEGSSGDAGPTGEQEVADHAAVLARTFDKLSKRLESERHDKAGELLERVRKLAERLALEHEAADVDEDDRPAAIEPPPEYGWNAYGELSLEHEFHNLGNDYYKIGRFDDAIDCYNIALELRPDLLETFFNRGLAWTRLSKYQKAWDDLTTVINLNPNLGEAYYTRGLVEEYRMRYDEAIADYEQALNVDPGYTKAETQMAIARDKKAQLNNPAPDTSASPTGDHDQINDFGAYRQTSTCTLAMVGGNHEAKHQLGNVVAFLAGNPAFGEWGVPLPRGVLLYGPPGTGKTLLARAVAGEVRCPFYCTPSTIFLNQYYGNTERNIRTLWTEASRHEGGAIIFIDEAEALMTLRSSLHAPRGDDCHNKAVTCVLECMDGMAKTAPRVVVIAATNRFDNIDDAFLRPGRFEYKIEVGLPNVRELGEIWLVQLELAQDRALRLDAYCRELRQVVRGDRERWLEDTFRLGLADATGVGELARLSGEHDLVGADVGEVIRRTAQERALVAIEWQSDLGPITPDDLLRHLRSYCGEDEAPQGPACGPAPLPTERSR